MNRHAGWQAARASLQGLAVRGRAPRAAIATIRVVCAAAAAIGACLAVPAEAANYTWTRGAGGSNGTWSTTTNWSPTAPSGGPAATDTVVIDANTGTTANTAMWLNTTRYATSVTFTGGATKWMFANNPESGAGTARPLVLTGGITVNAGSGPVFVGYALTPTPSGTSIAFLSLTGSGNQSITNNSANTLSFGNGDNYDGATYRPGSEITGTGGNMTFTFAGTGAGDIVVNGKIQDSSDSVVSTIINRSGRTVVFSEDNGATGTVSIQAGTLQVGSGTNRGRASNGGAIDIASSGTLLFNRIGAYTVTSVISGSGSIVNSALATVRLTGSSSFTGTTTINSGTVQIGYNANAGYLPGNIVIGSGASLAAGGTAAAVTIPGSISGLGDFTKLQTNLATLTGSNTYAGLTWILGGTLALSGNGSIGTGGLSLGTGGVFDIGGIAAAAYVLPATGNLTGSGRLAGLGKALQVQGSFRPGNSAGTVTLDANMTLDLSTSATSTFEITSPAYTGGSYDLVAGSGAAVLGGVLNLEFSGGTFANQADAVKIFDVAGGLTGGFTVVTFSGLVEGQSATFNPSTGYVSLALIPEPGALVGALVGGGCAACAALRRRGRPRPGRSGGA